MSYSIKINLIVAAAENNVIGDKNKMLWHLPNDLKFFKNKTMGHSVLMGRKTFDSLGKPLPERRNIIITRDKDYRHEDVDIANSVEEAISYCRDEREIFIIGGGQIYKTALPLANRIYMTRVHTKIDGSTTFPELDTAVWRKVSVEKHSKDDRHPYDYTFEVYDKI